MCGVEKGPAACMTNWARRVMSWFSRPGPRSRVMLTIHLAEVSSQTCFLMTVENKPVTPKWAAARSS